VKKAIEGETKSRDSEFFEAHRRWRTARGLPPDEAYPTMRYVLLHSLAHALLRQFGMSEADTPVVACGRMLLLRNPANQTGTQRSTVVGTSS